MAEKAICPRCGSPLGGRRYLEYGVCDAGGCHLARTANQRLEFLVDRDSFRELDRKLVSVDPLHFADVVPYSLRLLRAQRETGLREAVLTGTAQIYGFRCVVAILDFRFLGGSMGSVVGEKVARAMEHAAKARLPFVAVTSSGGARLQEGMLSLVQMAKTTAAAARLHAAGVALVTILADPTTGGVLASYAAQADILLAEPGARIGFAGPRVVREVTGHELPPNFQSAEFLRDRGLIDAVVARPGQRDALGTVLGLLAGPRRPVGDLPRRPGTEAPATPAAWEAVELARHPERPTSVDYLDRLCPRFVELHGDRVAADDPSIVGGIAELGGMTVMVIAQERGRGDEAEKRHRGHVGPAGFRKALRLMRLAARLGLPLVTLIDTPGAELSVEAEAGGLAETISACLGELAMLPIPIVSVVIGEGGSGGALALGVADRALMQENAIYSVIAPEGAAAILYRSKDRAHEVAEALKLTAGDCLRLGVVDASVPEPSGGAHRDPDLAARQLRDAILLALADVTRQSTRKLVAARYEKYRHIGRYDTRLHKLLMDRLAELRAQAVETVSRLVDVFRRRDAPEAPEEEAPGEAAPSASDRRR
ncbi:MAG TPA: acetyl-CoA carboxylase carboxyltransferase subunit alpha/beta [Chloroflexota bacterium]|nr:acetyl-CoA carboxylase carboxyltransferase subunit alpha/beta [Chloroflexota bacterium]